jgi:hypothetical protein
MFPGGETVTILTAGETVDPYSTETSESWADGDVTSEDVDNVLIGDGGSVEPLQDARNQVTSDFDLIFQPPLDTIPTAQSRVVVRGLTCKVVGRPFPWRWPSSGTDAGMVVKAEIVEG